MDIEKLISLADYLDKSRHTSEADQLDVLINKLVEEEKVKKADLIESPDPEMQKKLQEEGWQQPKILYDAIKKEPNKGTIVPGIPDEHVKSMLSYLVNKGWSIFAPGEREKFYKAPIEMEELITDPEREHIEKELEPVLKDKKAISPNKQLKKEFEIIEEEKNELRIEEVIEEFNHMMALARNNKTTLVGKEVDDFIEAVKKFCNFIEHRIRTTKASDLDSEMLEKLADVADKLDGAGSAKEAEMIDELIKKYSEKLTYRGEDPKADQSKAYDSKYHHKLQVRDVKKKKDTDAKHHIETYQDTGAGTLSTRTCPSHIGVSLGRVGEGVYQCPIDGQIYNWELGWTDADGNQIHGSSVAGQTADSSGVEISQRIFDSRDKILNTIN